MCDLLQPEINPIENPSSLKTAPWNETQGRSEHPIQRYHHLKIQRWRKFDSHVTPNYDEYEKSARKNVDAVVKLRRFRGVDLNMQHVASTLLRTGH